MSDLNRAGRIARNFGGPVTLRNERFEHDWVDHRAGFSNWDRAILHMYWRRCAYCGAFRGPFHIDHIRPLASGGLDELENLTLACSVCNLLKGSSPEPMPCPENECSPMSSAVYFAHWIRGALRGCQEAVDHLSDCGITVGMLRRSSLAKSAIKSDLLNLLDHITVGCTLGHVDAKGRPRCSVCGIVYRGDPAATIEDATVRITESIDCDVADEQGARKCDLDKETK